MSYVVYGNRFLRLYSRSLAAVKKIFVFFSLGVELLEVAHDLADAAHDGEAPGVLPDQLGEGGDLALVDDADQKVLLLTGIHALGRDQGAGVVELFDDVPAQLRGIVGDDLKADGAAAGFEHIVGDGAGHEAVEDAKDHRLDLEAVDKIADEGHADVDDEGDIEEVQVGPLDAHQARHIVHAAGVGAAFDQEAVDRTGDDTGHQGAENGAGAVFRVVGKGTQIELFKDHQHHGEGDNIDHRPEGQLAVDELEDHQ